MRGGERKKVSDEIIIVIIEYERGIDKVFNYQICIKNTRGN